MRYSSGSGDCWYKSSRKIGFNTRTHLEHIVIDWKDTIQHKAAVPIRKIRHAQVMLPAFSHTGNDFFLKLGNFESLN